MLRIIALHKNLLLSMGDEEEYMTTDTNFFNHSFLDLASGFVKGHTGTEFNLAYYLKSEVNVILDEMNLLDHGL